MNMNETFVAEKRAAMHCDQLVAKSDEPSNGLGTFKRFGQSLAPAFAKHLGDIFNSNGWEAQAGEPESMLARELSDRIEKVAGNFILPVGDVGGRLFASFSVKPIMRRLEAMFGGDVSGEEIELGEKLPSSVELLLRKLEKALTRSIGETLDEAALRKGEVAKFDTDYAKLAVFPGQVDAIVLPLSFATPTGTPLTLTIACRPITMLRLMAHFSDGAPSVSPKPSTMLDPAFCEIPLPLRARLAEMRLPASKLMNLKPGQTLPLAVARSVPIFAGRQKLATGVVGEQDDRVALQIDKVLMSGEKS